MKNFILLAAILLALSCSKDDDPSGQEEVGELKTISVNIELPVGSDISADELTVSSLFSENMPVNNNKTKIESFNEDSMELTFASNSEGNIIMLSYFNPINADVILMNTETTALALVMLHPWSFDLTANAKAEAITYIKNLPEFEAYKTAIETRISSGESNPLNAQSVLEKVTEIQQITFNRISEYIEPLEFNVNNSTASVKNLHSSASYSIGLYDENNVHIEHKLAEGVEKSHFLFQEFRNNFYQETTSDSQTATFNIPSNGDWTLKAKSGLSFDETLENQEAAFRNTTIIVANLFGLVSSVLEEKIKKKKCFISMGMRLVNDVSGSIIIGDSLMAFERGNKTGYGLTKDILYYFSNRFQSIKALIEGCASEDTDLSQLKNLQHSFLGKVFSLINAISKIESSFNTTAMLTDWVQFDKEIIYCFNKNGSEIEELECTSDLVLNGDFSSGNTNFTSSYTYCNSSNCLFDLANNGYAIANDASSRHIWFIGKDHTDGNGQFMIINGAIPTNVVWRQTINISANKYYIFEAYISTLYSQNISDIIVKINGTQLGTSFPAPSSVNQWTKLSRTWNSGSSSVAVIEIFSIKNIATGNDFGLDDISFKQQ